MATRVGCNRRFVCMALSALTLLGSGCTEPIHFERATAASPGAVTGIHHVLLTVQDLPRSIHFYRDVLGMRLEHESGTFAMLEAGTAGVALSTRPWDFEKTGEPKGIGMIPHLTTPDMDAFAASLRSNGVTWLREPVRESFAMEAFIADPDGYQWAILAPFPP
jgi:catechol 2,3-dioxygenase-like lactoylglutathione lyase family enzyme